MSRRRRTNMLRSVSAAALLAAPIGIAAPAAAQTANPVSACAGVQLTRATVTGIVAPIVSSVATQTQSGVNGLIGALGVLAGGAAPLSIDASGAVTGAASGAPIQLRTVNTSGTPVAAGDRCDLLSSSYGLANAAGIAIGGNGITGLGTGGLTAAAGDATAIALGNGALTGTGAGNAVALGTGAAANAAGALALGGGAVTETGAVNAIALGAGATVGAAGSLALGAGATVGAANSLALGAGSTATRGAQAAYAAARLTAPQASAGEVSVGLAGLERQVTNVAAGSAPTDAVNVAQLAALGYDVDNLAQMAVRYDGPGLARVVLGTVGNAVNLANVAAGQIVSGSLDAVNGGQLFAVDAAVTVNASDIANLRTQVANLAVTINAGGGTGTGGGGTTVVVNGGRSPVQYANAATPTTPNGGTVSNDVTIVGANGGPVAVHNVAAGQVAAGSTDAVNGGQLYATNQAVATAQGDATAALAMGRNSVQYDDASHTSVTLGGGANPVAIHNVGPGTAPADAVNVAQLDAASSATLGAAKSYTDGKIAALSGDLDQVRRDANGGTTMALAAAALPQPYEAGKGMLALAGGTYRGEAAFAVGASKAFVDGHTVLKMGATYGTHASVGASAGLGYQF